MLLLYKEVVKLPTSDTPPASRISNDNKYKTYFADCVGALDGTHIDVHVSPADQPRYRNRKGHLTQNVLAVCDFDMRFTHLNQALLQCVLDALWWCCNVKQENQQNYR
jgi:hypothetical protein